MDRQAGLPGQLLRRAVGRGVMLVALTASALPGQPDSTRGLRTIGHLPTATFYKIHTHNRSILYGRILGISRDSFRLTSGRAARSDTSAALRDITAVWFRHGSEGGKGLLIGTGIGVGLGLLLGSRDAGGPGRRPDPPRDAPGLRRGAQRHPRGDEHRSLYQDSMALDWSVPWPPCRCLSAQCCSGEATRQHFRDVDCRHLRST